jgi:ferrous iron transport protein B
MLDIAEKQKVRIDIDALAARLGCPVIPLVSTRGRGIEALKMPSTVIRRTAILSWSTIRSRCCAKLTCWRSRCQRRSRRQRRWLGLQMLEGDIYSRAYAGDAADKLDIALANLSDEIDDPALHIADALSDHRRHLRRRQQHPDRRAKPLHRGDGQSDPQPLPRVADFSLCHVPDVPAGDQHRRRAAADFDAGSVAIFIHGIQWLGYTLHFPDWLTVFLAQGSAAVSTPCCRWCRRSA